MIYCCDTWFLCRLVRSRKQFRIIYADRPIGCQIWRCDDLPSPPILRRIKNTICPIQFYFKLIHCLLKRTLNLQTLKYSSSVYDIERKMSDRKHLEDLLHVTGLPVFGCFTLISEKMARWFFFLKFFRTGRWEIDIDRVFYD